jgi:hypothetical protein
MSFVLFCWMWCFIAKVLWVHLCNFSVAIVFLFMVISMAFVFSLHYSCSCIVDVLTLRLLLHHNSFVAWIFSFLCVIFQGGSNVCVFCVVYRFLVLRSSMWILHIFYVDFMCFIKIQTFVFYFMFLFSIFACWFNLLLFFFS